jgi:hypothetical protein
LTLAPDVELSDLFGKTLRLFNWNGVVPVGEFRMVCDSGWDVSQLNTLGEVTFIGTSTIPEPSALVLLGVGVLCLIAFARLSRMHHNATSCVMRKAYAAILGA